MKSKLKRGLFMALGITLSLVLAEFVVGRFLPQRTLSQVQSISFRCFEEGEHRWVKMKKNASCLLRSMYDAFAPVMVHTNSFGMRNPEISLQKPPGTKRILFIGDSFTMGWGVEEENGYVRLTEKFLKEAHLSYPVQTINAGFTAAGPSGYYLSLKLDGLQFDPDVVVVGFFLGNDILSRKDVEWVHVDNQGLPNVVRSKSTYIDATGQLRLKELPLAYHVPYLRRSHLFILIMNALFKDMVIPGQESLIADTICVFNRSCHDFDQAKSEVKVLFSAMHALLKNNGKKLVVAIIPTHFQVHFNVEYKTRYSLPIRPSERRFLNDEFIQFFQEQGIEYVDLLPPLIDAAGQNRLYFNQDDHWNENGHKVAADAITEKLVELETEQ